MLLIHPIGYNRSEQNKSVRDEELIYKKVEHLSIHLSSTDDLTVHFGQCISTKDNPFVRNMYVYARSIRYVIEFSRAVSETASQASIKLLKFCKHRPPTAACLIERAADDLINFQAVVKKRGFTSFDELLKYCRLFSNFQQQSRTGLEITGCFERTIVLFCSTDYLSFRFQ